MDKLELQTRLLKDLTSESSLNEVCNYIKKVVEIREFNEPPLETLLLLVEEVGELAKALRLSHSSMQVDQNKMSNYSSVKEEVADVFFVLVSICNTLNISLFDSLKEKELENINRVWVKSHSK